MCLFVRQLWQTLQTLYINIANIFDLFFFFCVFFFLGSSISPFPHFSFLLPVSVLSHFWETGSTGVKLMWWKTTGISLWAICFAVMATFSPLSVFLHFLLQLGGMQQISQQLSEVTSQVHHWPHSCQAHSTWNHRCTRFLSKLCVSDTEAFLFFFFCWIVMFKILPELCVKH